MRSASEERCESEGRGGQEEREERESHVEAWRNVEVEASK